MESQGGHVMTIANSIIGVGILAMPYCFKQCGLILSSLMLIVSSIISRLSCHFLLKSSVIAKHKSIESLALYTFGSCGKLTIELGIIGFLLGTCIAFFVVIGDLGPQIIADMVGIPVTDTLRTTVLIFLAVFCILPLGLLRQVDSLTVVCTAAIIFYMCLVLKIMAESAPHLMYGDWYNQVSFWRTEGILQCLPIFSMALFCQTQLFEIYQAIPNASLDRMNNMIRTAVNICTCVYVFVGTFGYIAVGDQPFGGNILLSFKSSIMTEIIKIGFVLSVAVSFPLIIFPCRASLFSMAFGQTYRSMEHGKLYIPDNYFRYLTVAIISVSLLIGVLVPNIELVLGLVGSTIGVLICVLFPATSFICLSKKNTNERIVAQAMIFVGILVMVLGTYANLNVELEPRNRNVVEKVEVLNPLNDVETAPIINSLTTVKLALSSNIIDKKDEILKQSEISNEVIHEQRREPPQPVEPEPESLNRPNPIIKEDVKPEIPPTTKNSVTENVKIEDKSPKVKENKENIEIGSEAINKEEKEIKMQEEDSLINEDKAELDKLKKQAEDLLEKINRVKDIKEKETINEKKDKLNELQKKTEELLKKQQNLLAEIKETANEGKAFDEIKAEKLKSIKEIESIAKIAIESVVVMDKNTEKNVLRDLVEPKKIKITVKPSVMTKTLREINDVNVSEPKDGKISNVPEKFVPIPIAKSNLSIYSQQDMKRNISKNSVTTNTTVERVKVTVKPETVSQANDNTIIKLESTQDASLTKSRTKLKDLKSDAKEAELEKQEEKIALDSVRRDILSLNTSRLKREVKTNNNLVDNKKDVLATLTDNGHEKICEKTNVSPT